MPNVLGMLPTIPPIKHSRCSDQVMVCEDHGLVAVFDPPGTEVESNPEHAAYPLPPPPRTGFGPVVSAGANGVRPGATAGSFRHHGAGKKTKVCAHGCPTPALIVRTSSQTPFEPIPAMFPSTTCVPSALRALLPPLLSRGACLIFPGFTMPVPIPLNECVLRDDRHLLWATIHSPYGPTRPCVGLLPCDAWRPLGKEGDGYQLLRSGGEEVARIVSLESLSLTTDRTRKLRDEQRRHEYRAAHEPAYARRWSIRFREASATADKP